MDKNNKNIDQKKINQEIENINNLESRYSATIGYIKNLTRFGMNLGLKRIESLLSKMGNPERELKIIHVAGTNGKGSTTAMIASILQKAGYSAGMFTSPHLHDYRERIRINSEYISKEDVIKGIERMKPFITQICVEGVEHPTEFEVSTALALWYFGEKKPDYVILEVGMGGEIDSTNVVQPLISVLTRIGMDHMNYLGNSFEDIAGVKAGIIKRGAPVITSIQRPMVMKVIEKRASEKSVRCVVDGRDYSYEGSGQLLNYYGINKVFKSLFLALVGEHQHMNASTAIATCEMLEIIDGCKISEDAVRRGLAEVLWPGRMEMISENPKIVLDGAHNVDGMNALARALNSEKEGLYKRERLILCFGMLADKEIDVAIKILAPLADEIVVTKPDSPRAGNWRHAAEEAEKYVGKENVFLVENPVEAAQICLKKMGRKDMMCVTGSLYMISVVREYLINR